MDDLHATRKLLAKQLSQAIAQDPLAALPEIAALKQEADEQLREAVRAAAISASWREIADALGVSKQAAHQRFKAYVKEVAVEIKSEHRAMKRARRSGDAQEAAKARERRDDLAAGLRRAAQDLKDGKRR